MFPTGSKLLVGGAVLATIAADRLRPHAGGLARHGRADLRRRGLAFLAGVNIYTRDADVSAMDTAALTESAAAARRPAPASGRSSAALGGVLVVVGLVTYPVVFIFGIIALLAAAVEWMIQAWSERASADVAVQRRRPRPHRPPARVPDARRWSASPSSSTRSAGSCCSSPRRAARRCSPSIAALILVVGFMVAFRPSIATGAIGAVCVDRRARAGRRRRRRRARGRARDRIPTRPPARSPTTGECDDSRGDRGRRARLADGRRQGQHHGRADPARGRHARSPSNLGVTGDQDAVIVTRANPTNVIFRNESGEERRLVLDLGTRPERRRADGDDDPARPSAQPAVHAARRGRRQPADDVLDPDAELGWPRSRTRSSCPASTAPRSRWWCREHELGAPAERDREHGSAPGSVRRPRRPSPRRASRRRGRRRPCWPPGAPRTPRRTRGSRPATNAQKIQNLQWPVFAIAGVVGVHRRRRRRLGDHPLQGPRPGDPQADPRPPGAGDRPDDPAGADPDRRRHPDRRHADGAVEDRRHRVLRQRHRPAVVVGDRLPARRRAAAASTRRSSRAARW